MESQYVCSVEKGNKLGIYHLHTIWQQDKLVLNVASKDAAWKGEISTQQLAEASKDKGMTPEGYIQNCKDSLTTSGGLPDVEYSVEGNFVWKKVLDADAGVKFTLGSIHVEPTSFVDTIQNMMSVSLADNQTLRQRLATAENEKNAAENNVNNLINKLESQNKAIEDMENDLMGRFLLLLNAKKRKISELQEELIKVKASSPTKKKIPTKRKAKAKDPDPYGDDTDEDMLPSLQTAGPSKSSSPPPEQVQVNQSDVNLEDISPVGVATRHHLGRTKDNAVLSDIQMSDTPNNLVINSTEKFSDSFSNKPNNEGSKSDVSQERVKQLKSGTHILDRFFSDDSP